MFTPVAEYKGVALAERKGGRRAMWNGTEYGTDGGIYFFLREQLSPDKLAVHIVESESVAKILIDDFPEDVRRQYMGMMEVVALLKMPVELTEQKRLELAHGEFVFDEHQGVFVYKQTDFGGNVIVNDEGHKS